MDVLLFIEAVLANVIIGSGISLVLLRGFREIDLHESRESKRMLGLQIEMLAKKVDVLEKR